jgi:GTP-binding protein
MGTHVIEFYSLHRAQRSIRRADVVLLLIDGVEPLSEPDKKLAAYIAAQYKPVVLVINKWDLARQRARAMRSAPADQPLDDAQLMEEFRQYLDAELRHLDFAPIAFITARDTKNVQAVLDVAQHLFKQANLRINTGRLNRAVRQVLTERAPSTSSGRKAKVFYATQIDVAPPTIVLFVNNPAYIDETYQRFLINRFRELLPYAEVPIRLIVRPRASVGGAGGGPRARALDEMGADELEDGATAPPEHPARPAGPTRRAANRVASRHGAPRSAGKPRRASGRRRHR